MTTLKRWRILGGSVGALLIALPATGQARSMQDAIVSEQFLRPPAEVAEAVLAPRHLNVTLDNPSPDGRRFATERESGPPTMALFAKPFHRLGGLQIDWGANRSRLLTVRSGVGIDITDGETGAVVSVESPGGARVSAPTWSPDGSSLAFLVHTETATHVFVADPETGRSRQITRAPVLATLYTELAWTADSRSILTVLVPESRGDPPAAPMVPTGPQVRHTTPETNRIRTYPDLLETPHEQALLEYYTTGHLAVIDVESQRTRRIGNPAMISELDVAPDGEVVRVATMRKPFSYIVPVRQFGGADELWRLDDGSVVTRLAEHDVRDGSPDDTTEADETPTRRSFVWRPDGEGLSFLMQAARSPDDSAGNAQSDRERSGRKDRVYQWQAPYDSSSQTVIYEADRRVSEVRYSPDATILFLTEQQGDRLHEYAVFLDDPTTKHTIRRGERQGFRTVAPTVLTKTLANGTTAVRLAPDGNHVFLSDIDYHDDPLRDGPQSYIDRLEIRSGEKTRVYESDNDGVFERVLAVLNDDVTRLLVHREGPRDVPDSYLRDVTTGSLRQLTNNTDHTPILTRAERRRYEVTRADGFAFSVDVTLPEDRMDGEPLPGMIWFYPREYVGQDDYDEFRERYNKNAFPNIRARSMDILTLLGYAVIEPDAPIVGERGRMNDNYVNDLRNNLAATIDFLDREGIVDRDRLGVGGHSYGAFGTVNAMVHTPFFKAGIAGDGNFNRTLTPFAFQRERRTLWEAPNIYTEMSPLFNADHLNGALLLYHGAEDQNVGTFPINSWRLFEAMEALGKTASLYVYPYEDHGPATEETLLDLWARWSAWLDTHVKTGGRAAEKATTDGGGR